MQEHARVAGRRDRRRASRLTDEMLGRAVVLGFLGAWIRDRAVEGGAEPFEAEDPSPYVAAVLVCLRTSRCVCAARGAGNEADDARVRVQGAIRSRGKQKMVPMTEEEVKALMTKGVAEFVKGKEVAGGETKANRGDAVEVPSLGGSGCGGGECRETNRGGGG